MGNQEETSWACVEATITGLVQGVGFRFFVERVAKRYGLTGYVMNLQGGGVKVIAEGPREALSLLLQDLREGPRLSSVEAVEVNWQEYRGRFVDFSIRF
ncbi:MAG: acylphosphatase [candidate division NC10 bacterium]|nr:acylphosphatase [candidate division NC10 bacterium]